MNETITTFECILIGTLIGVAVTALRVLLRRD